jgi:hypothetical protein
MTAGTLRIISIDEIPSDCSEPVDAKALEQARAIVDSIRAGGEKALVATATKFGDIKEGESYTYTKEELKTAYDSLPKDQQGVLTRVVSAPPAKKTLECHRRPGGPMPWILLPQGTKKNIHRQTNSLHAPPL